MVKYKYDDGGRSDSGFKGLTGDCGVRAIAIAVQLPYQDAYDGLNAVAKNERRHKGKKRSNARTGVTRKTFQSYLKTLGWEWVPTMRIGEGCKVHLNANELPSGRIIAYVSRHFCAVIDGTIHDTYDPSRGGSRCVYGYFKACK